MRPQQLNSGTRHRTIRWLDEEASRTSDAKDSQDIVPPLTNSKRLDRGLTGQMIRRNVTAGNRSGF